MITLYVTTYAKLTQVEKDFVTRKHLQNKNDITVIDINFEEEQGEWRFADEATLLTNNNDWRKGFPVYELYQNYLFHPLPASHFKYDPTFYPYNLFEVNKDNQESILLLPYGEFYVP